MTPTNGYAAYQNSKIMTASPAELTLMLYDGAIKFANIAVAAIEKNDIEKAHNNIMKVERIILEFKSSLDHKYPVAKDFEQVYNYLIRRLHEANMKKATTYSDGKKFSTTVWDLKDGSYATFKDDFRPVKPSL